MMNDQDQAGAWRIRKYSRSRRFIAMLTPWRSGGQVIHAGDFVQSFNLAWQAQNSGTTGTVAPNNSAGNTVSDGSITWTHVSVLLTQQPNI